MVKVLALSVLVTAEVNLTPGQKLRREGKFDQAISFFQERLVQAPEAWPAQRELGHSLALAGRYREAIESYGRAGAASDSGARQESARWTGFTHLYLGEIDQAFSRLKQEAELAEQNGDRASAVHATWYRGHVLTELLSFGPANAAFLEALALLPQDLNTLHLLGVLTARQGDAGSLRYQIEDLRQLAQVGERGQVRRVYHLQGELELLRGKPGAALPLLERANRAFPHPLYREALARAQLAQGQLEAAAASYRGILQATDERLDIPLYYVKGLFGLAKVLEASGKKEAAASSYQRFLDHWGNAGSLPGVAEARERLRLLGADSSDAAP